MNNILANVYAAAGATPFVFPGQRVSGLLGDLVLEYGEGDDSNRERDSNRA